MNRATTTAAEIRLMDEAVAATGLSDFGEHDDFRIGLRVLMAAADDAGLDDAARDALDASCVAALATRLHLVQLRSDRPMIAAERIDGPVAVIGLPRTGTTALVDLLAQDPSARAPMQWETAGLFPPATREEWSTDPRIAADPGSLRRYGARQPHRRPGSAHVRRDAARRVQLVPHARLPQPR